MELDNFPKISSVKKSISKFKLTGFPVFKDDIEIGKFVEIISGLLTNEFGILPNILKPFKHQDFPLKFFRVRDVDSISDINLIREHSYPPINFVGMGRCNFPKHPVFYCSDTPLTALTEVIRNQKVISNKRYCISKWELLSPDEELLFQSFLQTKLPKENQYSSVRDNLIKNINNPFMKSLNMELDKELEEGLLEYLNFLDTSFITDNNYSLSATLAHRAIYSDHNMRTDILFYPSVQTQSKGVNMALNPNFVENNLKLSRLYIVESLKYNILKDTFELKFFKYAEVERNQIMWKEIMQDDDHFFHLMTEDFGNMINKKRINQ